MFCRNQESIEGGPSTAHLGFGVFHSEKDGLSVQGASVSADLQLWKANKGSPSPSRVWAGPGSSSRVATRASPKGRSGERASWSPSDLPPLWPVLFGPSFQRLKGGGCCAGTSGNVLGAFPTFTPLPPQPPSPPKRTSCPEALRLRARLLPPRGFPKLNCAEQPGGWLKEKPRSSARPLCLFTSLQRGRPLLVPDQIRASREPRSPGALPDQRGLLLPESGRPSFPSSAALGSHLSGRRRRCPGAGRSRPPPTRPQPSRPQGRPAGSGGELQRGLGSGARPSPAASSWPFKARGRPGNAVRRPRRSRWKGRAGVGPSPGNPRRGPPLPLG